MVARYVGSIHKRNLPIAFLALLPFPASCLNDVDVVLCTYSMI
jgi:hypothetical protein